VIHTNEYTGMIHGGEWDGKYLAQNARDKNDGAARMSF